MSFSQWLHVFLTTLFVRIYRSVRQYSYVTTVGMGVVMLKDIYNRIGNDDISYVAVFFLANPVRSRTAHVVIWFEHCYLRNPEILSILHAWPQKYLLQS